MGARRRLANNGLVTVALAVGRDGRLASHVEVASIGLPLDEDMGSFIVEAQEDAAEAVRTLKGDRKKDRVAIAECVRLAVRRCAQRWFHRRYTSSRCCRHA